MILLRRRIGGASLAFVSEGRKKEEGSCENQRKPCFLLVLFY